MTPSDPEITLPRRVYETLKDGFVASEADTLIR
jgi:hypothetical protein